MGCFIAETSKALRNLVLCMHFRGKNITMSAVYLGLVLCASKDQVSWVVSTCQCNLDLNRSQISRNRIQKLTWTRKLPDWTRSAFNSPYKDHNTHYMSYEHKRVTFISYKVKSCFLLAINMLYMLTPNAWPNMTRKFTCPTKLLIKWTAQQSWTESKIAMLSTPEKQLSLIKKSSPMSEVYKIKPKLYSLHILWWMITVLLACTCSAVWGHTVEEKGLLSNKVGAVRVITFNRGIVPSSTGSAFNSP